jgi:melibiose permease
VNLTLKQKIAYGIGAVGKDMVYALSSSYILYYYQDIIGLNSAFVGLILMIARIFDAFNDPIMGILVAKTHSKRFGRFRPWLFTGTVLNSFVLYAMFAAPSNSDIAGKMVFFSFTYILWGMTYTMMDIPYWSMIPAVTETPKDKEVLSIIGRTCAGVGSALIAMSTMMLVPILGGGNERIGFKYFALIIALIFIIAETITCVFVKERNMERIEVSTVKQMIKALLQNDQAIIIVISIVLINMSLFTTSNLIIYFFKYDVGGQNWYASYTLFSTICGGMQILAMMIFYPLLRKKLTTEKVFLFCMFFTILGYLILLILSVSGITEFGLLLIPGIIVFSCNGMLSVLTTVFLTYSIDYGELKTGSREESVIFSMQTFVVKLSSAIAVFITGIGLNAVGFTGNNSDTGEKVSQSVEALMGLKLLMTIFPSIVLILATFLFVRKFKLKDTYIQEIHLNLLKKKASEK